MSLRMFLILVLSLSVLNACGSEETKKKAVCTDSETRSCDCPDAPDGVSTCTGGRWGSCVCPADTCATNEDCGESQLCLNDQCVADTDGDMVADADDNCPEVANPEQEDSNADGVGDACSASDDDRDGDGVLNDADNCPDESNADQANLDSDAEGDACDADDDGDFVDDVDDNCPRTSNGDQGDTNQDGVGDACDQDSDGIEDNLDNCPRNANPDQSNIDNDDVGDVCDGDRDNDGINNPIDNCPDIENADQLDADSDQSGDVCDDDDDNDSVLDTDDNCPLARNLDQADQNNNGIGDACDDGDNDGVIDRDDNCPNESNPGQEVVDTDTDGLEDCVERDLGLNPNVADQDMDGLNDGQELARGTDPANPDSDMDGLNDGDEVAWGLDPTLVDSFGDGIPDSMRPFIATCQSSMPNTTLPLTNLGGGYTLNLSAVFNSYTTLAITGATAANAWSASVFRESLNGISGFVSTFQSNESAESILARRQNFLDSGRFQERFVTADGYSAVRSRSYARGSVSADTARNGELFGIAPFAATNVTNLPAATGTATNVSGHITVIERGTQRWVIGVFAPSVAGATDAAQALMDDVSNTTALGPLSPTTETRCAPRAAAPPTPVELYWVMDQSGSMQDDYVRLQADLPGFLARMNSSYLDYRLSMTNMDLLTNGRIRSSPGWHTTTSAFNSELTDYVINCSGCGMTSQYEEWALQGAQAGLTWMKSGAPQSLRPRLGAPIATIFLSDEETQSIQNNPLGTTAGDALMAGFESFFETQTIVYAAIGDGGSCGSDGEAYRRVATASGGFHGDLCDDFANFLDRIFIDLVGTHSPYTLTDAPITGTLRVYVNGVEVPRSLTNGWFYSPKSNAIGFVGAATPTAGAMGDSVTAVYQTLAP